MNTCSKVLLFFIILLIISASILNYKEHFTIELIKKPNLESCWQHISEKFKWKIDNYTEEEKKVLLTMKKLNANSYEDNNKFFPGWNACVIPKEHFPIFNIGPESTAELDLYNPKNPKEDSKGYMRYTNINESPEGYVINLTNHNEQSFKKFLDGAYELYDKEYLDERKKLEEVVKYWEGEKKIKTDYLNNLKNNILWNINEYDKLMNSSSECQKDRTEMERLQKELDVLNEINNKIVFNVSAYKTSINNNNVQIDKMLVDYNNYSGQEKLTRDSLKKINT